MHKDFDSWNEKKKKLDSSNKKFLFKEREIWWCSLGINVGKEIYGKGENFRRPVLILKKLSKYTFVGLPISSRIKIGTWYFSIIINNICNTVLLDQIKLFSVNRLQHRFSILDSINFTKIKQKLKNLLEL